MAFALEERTSENVGQSNREQDFQDIDNAQGGQNSSAISETKEILAQKESVQTTEGVASFDNIENLAQTENTVSSEQKSQEVQESDLSVPSVSDVVVNQKNNEEILQEDVAHDKLNTLQSDNSYSQAQGAFTWASYFQAIGIMLFLLLILWYVLKLVRKFGNGRFLPSQKLLPRDSLYLEGQLPLGPGKSVVVANILGQRLVLGVTEKNITLITKMVDNEDLEYEQIFQEKLQKTE